MEVEEEVEAEEAEAEERQPEEQPQAVEAMQNFSEQNPPPSTGTDKTSISSSQISKDIYL